MNVGRIGKAAVCALVLAALAACGPAEPFVFKKAKFDRDSLYFNRKPDDISEVMICYRRGGTTPQAVASLANQRCGDFGKVARPRGHSLLDCPLLTPAGAVFDCVKPQ